MPKEILGSIYLFKSMGPDEIHEISKICKVESVAANQSLFQEGEEAKSLFVVKYGTVRLSHTSATGEVVEIATLGSGDHFGEMPFIDGKKRNATAETLESCEIVWIPYADLRKVLDSYPLIAARFYRAISKFLSARLSITTHDLSFARGINLKHHVG